MQVEQFGTGMSPEASGYGGAVACGGVGAALFDPWLIRAASTVAPPVISPPTSATISAVRRLFFSVALSPPLLPLSGFERFRRSSVLRVSHPARMTTQCSG